MSKPENFRDSEEAKDLLPREALRRLLNGYQVSQLIYVAAKLSLADLLKDGPKSCDELARDTGTPSPLLYRLLRGIASVGVLNETKNGYFELTPLGTYLQTTKPGSLRARAIMSGEMMYQSFSKLIHSVRTAETAFNHVYNMGIFQYLAQNAEIAEVFNQAMTADTTHMATAVVGGYDFSGFTKIVDVGGGHGTLIASILKANPNLSGVLFDTSAVIAGAKKYIKAAGLASRCKTVAGDFFKSVTRGGDAYILSRIIHDWDDERSISILKNCRRAMVNYGKILVVELVMPERVEASPAIQTTVMYDLTMMVMTGGRERTKSEYKTLFESAGFKLMNIIPTQSPLGYGVIEGRRI